MRETIRDLLDVALEAVDPAQLTRQALEEDKPATRSVIAIGKAAPGMTRGTREALGPIGGICVSAEPAAVPDGVEGLVGDHPVPGKASFEAGRRVLRTAAASDEGCVVLVSGGGSSLCEWPRPGVHRAWLREVHKRLLFSGATIRDTNIVRGHLSAIKCGGLARAGTGPYPTYILSDVAGEGPEIVASGPTVPMGDNPERAREILEDIGMEIPSTVWSAMSADLDGQIEPAPMTVVGDGLTAARAIADRASALGIEARLSDGWLTGESESAIDRFLSEPAAGVTITTGETTVKVGRTHGHGGRNTHAALLAAERISGTDWLFGAFATDGVDGSAGAAGAIVDGETLNRGGNPSRSLGEFDSATYLGRSGDLVITGPTGTNVADLWVLLRP